MIHPTRKWRWDLEPVDPPNDVELYTSPWVSGTQAQAYSPICAQLFFPDGALEDRVDAWEKAERELLEAMRDQARALGANAVVGLTVELDPFACQEERDGLRLRATGTAAKLVPL